MPVSERLRSRWGPSRLAHHGDLRSSQWGKPQELIGRPSSEKIRACSDILSDALSGRPHQSLRCHPEQSLCSGEFGCRLFIKHSPWTVCFLLVVWKKLACFYEPQFCRVSPSISLSDSALETKKLQAEVLKSTCRTIQVLKLLQKADFDSLTLLTALLLYSQSDYLNYTKRDSDWLTLACFMRV